MSKEYEDSLQAEVAALREQVRELEYNLANQVRLGTRMTAAARVEGLREARRIISTLEDEWGDGSEAIKLIDAEIAALERGKICQTCGGSGAVDSGGVQPWGAAIYIRCPDCALE